MDILDGKRTPEPLNVSSGKWWRYDRYELTGGYIRPAPDARLEEFESWEDYWSSEHDGKVPYETLTAVLMDPPRDGPGSSGLTVESEQRLLDWCGTYGLLGILLHRAQEVILAPRWESCGDVEKAEGHGFEVFAPTLRRFVKTPFAFEEVRTQAIHLPNQYFDEDATRRNQPVTAEHRPPDWPRPSVVLRGFDDDKLVTEPITKTWALFFPDIPEPDREVYSYPTPGTAEFWRLYAEPVDAFLEGAHALVNTLTLIASAPGRLRVDWALSRLHALTAAVRPALVQLDDGSFRQEWVATSLLGSMAMMALQDLSHRRFLRCARCGRLCATKRDWTKYCSDTCRETAQKRRYRDGLKAKQNNLPDGKTG